MNLSEDEIQKLWKEFTDLLLSTKRQGMESLIQWLDTTDFKYAPASSMYHSSYRGGLLKHSLNVYYCMFDFQSWIDFMEVPLDTIIITSLLHDLCKINCYVESTRNVKDENGKWTTVPFYQYDEELPWGHGQKSVILIMQHGVMLNNVEISMIVNHMGYTETDDARRVGKLFRVCPQCNILHQADVEATTILESYDGPQRFIDKLKIGGNNLTECMKLINSPKTIRVDNVEYTLASPDAIVDNSRVLLVNYEGQQIKVLSPVSDGLPF